MYQNMAVARDTRSVNVCYLDLLTEFTIFYGACKILMVHVITSLHTPGTCKIYSSFLVLVLLAVCI